MGTLAFILFDVVQVSLVVDGVVKHGIISSDEPGGKCNVTWLDGTFSAGAPHPALPHCNLTHRSASHKMVVLSHTIVVQVP